MLPQISYFTAHRHLREWIFYYIRLSYSHHMHYITSYKTSFPVGWGCRIHRLLFCKDVRPPTNDFIGYDTKESDNEALVMLELWGMRGIPSLPSLRGQVRHVVEVPDRILSMGQIELNCELVFNWIASNRFVLTFKLRTYAKLNYLK